MVAPFDSSLTATLISLIDRVSDLVGMTDSTGTLVHMNRTWRKAVTLGSDEVPEQIVDCIVDDDKSRFDEIWHKVQLGQLVRHINMTLITPANPLPCEASFIPSLDFEGNFSGAIVIFQPMSASFGHETTRSAALANIREAVVITNLDNKIQSWNHVAEVIYGWKQAEVKDRTFSEIVPTIYENTTASAVSAQLNSEGYWRGEVSQVCRDGNTIHMLTAASIVHDAEGLPVGIVTTYRDISERKKIDTELRLLTKAVESSNSAITIADATQPDIPLVYVNPAFERITGYSEDEILGKNCRFLQGDDRDQPELEEIRNALRNSAPCVVTLRNYRKDGTLFWNELRITPMHDDSGRATHFVGIATDITDRKVAEQQIQAQNEALLRANHALAQARQQAEQATRLKSEFLATISHELRTPLNAIIGYTEIQLAGMAGEINDEQRDSLERVLINADHLLSLINDVLDISKIEAGRVELVHKPYDAQQLMNEIIEQTRGLAERKGLAYQNHMDERLPRALMGDPARLKQIAINLLSNAIKFTDEGFVKIEMRQQTDDTWTMTVSDSGAGIPAHEQETIFEEFRQLDSSWTRKYSGTGLGLSIVRKLVLLMGGNIRVSSEVGKGSTFTIFLPLNTAQDEA